VDDWVGEIVFDPAVERKLREKHQLTPYQIRLAVAYGGHDRADWDDDPRYGRRLILTGSDDHGELVVCLRPIDRMDGRGECLTAWRI
jgi:hypothetical protein